MSLKESTHRGKLYDHITIIAWKSGTNYKTYMRMEKAWGQNTIPSATGREKEDRRAAVV
jgi:hypothetical protein